MCSNPPPQAQPHGGEQSGTEAGGAEAPRRLRGAPHPGGQAVAKMPASVARPRPRPGPSPASPLPLLLLLEVLSGPVCGRVPPSVPRISLPISGKARAPSPLFLRAAPRPRLQVPGPTCPPHPGSRTRAPTAQPTASRDAQAPPGCGRDPGRDPHLVLLQRAGRLGYYDQPRRLPRPLIKATAPHRADADPEAQGGEWGLPETLYFEVSSPLFRSSLTCTCVRHASVTPILLSNPSVFHTTPNTHPSDYQLSISICPLLKFIWLSSVLTSSEPFAPFTTLISLTHLPVLSSLTPTPIFQSTITLLTSSTFPTPSTHSLY